MARRAEETENHWPGYVDALSTIVMVVTFLLILLGIVIYVLSQNIAAQMVADNNPHPAESGQEQQMMADKSVQAGMAAQGAEDNRRPEDARKKEAASQAEAAAPQDKSAANAKVSEGFRTRMSDALTADEASDATDKIAVLARTTRDEKRIVVSTEQQAGEERKIRIETSQALLTLVFGGGVRISEQAAGEIKTFLSTQGEAAQPAKYEVRAFSTTGKGSISEARRVAYYRALSVRNELLAIGVSAERIAIKVSPSSRAEETDTVKVYQK